MTMEKITLRTLVITSKVTFVPSNYDHLIAGLATCPQVAGLLVLDNRNLSTFTRSISALVHGAYRIGSTLISNQFNNSHKRRAHAYASQKKPVWTLKRLNSPETVKIIDENRFNLLLNARARAFFEKDILEKPVFGAINIHHGLLPEQRGTMCDLWSLFNQEPCGFSIHKMNSEIDGGDILKVVKVSDGMEKDYLEYLRKSAHEELKAVRDILEKIELAGEIETYANVIAGQSIKRRDPTRKDIKLIKRKALLI